MGEIPEVGSLSCSPDGDAAVWAYARSLGGAMTEIVDRKRRERLNLFKKDLTGLDQS